MYDGMTQAKYLREQADIEASRPVHVPTEAELLRQAEGRRMEHEAYASAGHEFLSTGRISW